MFKEKSSLYREILRLTWKITWQERLLWVLGVFSALIVTGGALEILSRNLNWAFNPDWRKFGFASSGFYFDWSGGPWLVVLGLLLAALFIFLAFMSVRSFSSLILLASQYREGRRLNLEKMWRLGSGHFWPILGIAAFFKILILVFSCLSVLPLWMLWAEQGKIWLWAYPLFFLAAICACLVCSFLLVYASAYVILEKKKFGSSILSAWRLFVKHWLVSLEMAAVIFAINFLFGLIALLGTVVVGLPFIILLLFSYFISLPILAEIGIFLAILFLLLLTVWIGGFLGTFHVVAWTLLFKRMAEGTALSKLLRLTAGLFAKK
ncbi:MAG: hypothetical protein HY982_00900 [Candidatus Magasanikbacteria bacterium]|nr:hypothetical protein [Candidatus Magasanikbacteria bacterium]